MTTMTCAGSQFMPVTSSYTTDHHKMVNLTSPQTSNPPRSSSPQPQHKLAPGYQSHHHTNPAHCVPSHHFNPAHISSPPQPSTLSVSSHHFNPAHTAVSLLLPSPPQPSTLSVSQLCVSNSLSISSPPVSLHISQSHHQLLWKGQSAISTSLPPPPQEDTVDH